MGGTILYAMASGVVLPELQLGSNLWSSFDENTRLFDKNDLPTLQAEKNKGLFYQEKN